MFARWQNHLRTHFSEYIPFIKQHHCTLFIIIINQNIFFTCLNKGPSVCLTKMKSIDPWICSFVTSRYTLPSLKLPVLESKFSAKCPKWKDTQTRGNIISLKSEHLSWKLYHNRTVPETLLGNSNTKANSTDSSQRITTYKERKHWKKSVL